MATRLLIPILVIILGYSGLFAQIPNVQISSPSNRLQNEEQVFINPTDSSNVIAVWRDWSRYNWRECGIGRSIDGGQNWTNHINELTLQGFNFRQSDPTLTVDRLGNFYCIFMDWDNDDFFGTSNYVLVKSTDKGATWDGPYGILSAPTENTAEDKQFITADRTGGTYDGNIYISWTRFPNPTRIVFARSTNGGVSFEDTVIVGPPVHDPSCGSAVFDAGQFSQPIVGSDGAIYVFWKGNHMLPDECILYTALKMSKSYDGGVTWPVYDTPIFAYNNVYTVDGGVDVYNSPAGDADITGGPYDGNIYVTTLNGVDDGPYYHSDILLLKSTDGGATWLPPIRINDDPLGVDVDQFLPWTVVNEDGVLVTIFYDQRIDPSHYKFDVFGAYSFDGGETYTTNHRITEVSSSPDDAKSSTNIFGDTPDPEEGTFDKSGSYLPISPKAGLIAEYIGVTAFHDYCVSVWTDTRNGNQDVYGAYYNIPFMLPRLFGADDGSFVSPLDSLYWTTCWHEDDDYYRIQIDDDPSFLSPEVNEIVTDNKFYALSPLSDGTYSWRVKAYRMTEDDSTDYCAAWTFSLDAQAPDAATLISPIDNIISSDSLPTFVWSYSNDVDGSPEYYEIEISDDDQFTGAPPYFHYTDIVDTFLTMPEALPDTGTYYWRVNHFDEMDNSSGYTVFASFNFIRFVCGDANGDLVANVGDAVYMINYVFKGGPAPDPLESGDANCDGAPNVGDAVYLINYVFKSGPEPCCP